MKILDREKLNEKLASIGIVKSPHYDATEEYDLQQGILSSIGIDNVADADKERVVKALLDALSETCDVLYLFPRLTYFNSEQEGAFFHLFDMKSLKDEAMEWSDKDHELINKIVLLHFLNGWHVGWDLYLATSDGSILILVCHHNEFHVNMSSIEIGKKFSRLLNDRSVEHELFPEDE